MKAKNQNRIFPNTNTVIEDGKSNKEFDKFQVICLLVAQKLAYLTDKFTHLTELLCDYIT